jgi:hypothetical protein
VECDDGHARAWRHAGGDCLQGLAERAEFVVHMDPERLENLRGWMARTAAGRDGFNGIPQGGGGFERLRVADLTELCCNGAGAGFLAVFRKNPCEFGFGKHVHRFGRGHSGRRPHTHVEGTAAQEGKSARGIVELVRGDANVEQDAVELAGFAHFVEHADRIAEIRLHKTHAVTIPGEALPALLEGFRILVERDD